MSMGRQSAVWGAPIVGRPIRNGTSRIQCHMYHQRWARPRGKFNLHHRQRRPSTQHHR
uniref:Uncharacterized protein n=1 Tax=Arundo donax TaxID=35708 RepID=A0A0A9C8W5_ARUDO